MALTIKTVPDLDEVTSASTDNYLPIHTGSSLQKISLSNLKNAIADKIYHASVSADNGGTIHFYRQGRFVFALMQTAVYDSVFTAGSAGTFLTDGGIPSGFRPLVDTDATATLINSENVTGTIQLRFTTTGKIIVRVSGTGADEYSFSAVYFSEATLPADSYEYEEA